MLASKMSRSLLQRAAVRSFSSQSVTYDFKDLILDPEQKGKPIYYLHHLEEN
jgi:hypothetical protein